MMKNTISRRQYVAATAAAGLFNLVPRHVLGGTGQTPPSGKLNIAVKCENECPYGLIRSDWQKKDGKFTMDVTVPANTTATVYVPAKDAAAVTESGKPAAEANGVKFLRMENKAAVYAVGSGTYRFQSALIEPDK